jgi:hypothetical protein
VNSLIPGRDQGSRRGRPPGRRGIRTGTGIVLIAAGAILRFAVAGSPHELNLHVVGVILILTGVLGLLLPSLARRPRKGDWLSRWVSPVGRDNPRLDEVKRAAAADVEVVRENDALVSPNAPGLRNDDL